MKIMESIMNAIETEPEKNILEQDVKESVGTETDIDNLDQKERDNKIIKLSKSLAGSSEIDEDKFRELKRKLTTQTYKMVDAGETYNLQKGEEVLTSWKKKSEETREDNEVVESDIPDANEMESKVEDIVGDGVAAAMDDALSEDNLEEGHTDTLVYEILDLAEKAGKNWTEEAIRKLTVPQMHVIKSKLLDPNYKTKKEKAKEEEKKNRAELIKTESDGVVKYKIRINESEEDLEADSDDDAISKFDDRFEEKRSIVFKDSGIQGLKTTSVDGFKIYLKELNDGTYSYIIRDSKSSVTLSSNRASDEDEVITLINSDLDSLEKEEV